MAWLGSGKDRGLGLRVDLEAREAAREADAERASLARQEAMEAEASRLRQQESDIRKRAEQEQWAEFNEWFNKQSTKG